MWKREGSSSLCRKTITSILENKDLIDVWGDGEQTRSFLYIDDVEGP